MRLKERIIKFLNLKELINEINNEPITVYIERTSEDIKLPVYAKIGDSGMDIRATKDITLAPGEQIIIPTGIKCAIPVGHEIQIRPRSGISARTLLRVANSPGTIDSGYKDELGVIIWNASTENTGTYYTDEKDKRHGTYIIRKGDRIAQIVLCKVGTIKLEEVPKGTIETIGNNRKGGFSSSGIREIKINDEN
jgi:dUTP pyrophosphatase